MALLWRKMAKKRTPGRLTPGLALGMLSRFCALPALKSGTVVIVRLVVRARFPVLILYRHCTAGGGFPQPRAVAILLLAFAACVQGGQPGFYIEKLGGVNDIFRFCRQDLLNLLLGGLDPVFGHRMGPERLGKSSRFLFLKLFQPLEHLNHAIRIVPRLV